MGRDKFRSSLLSDWTRGLVGCMYTKLDDIDEDTEGGEARKPSGGSAYGILLSNLNGVKSRGGEVAKWEWCSR
jgi:hypothetical protein